MTDNFKMMFYVVAHLLFLTKVSCIPINCNKACTGSSYMFALEHPPCYCLNDLGDLKLTDEQFVWTKNPEGISWNFFKGGSMLTAKWNSVKINDSFYRIPFFFSKDIHNRPNHILAINKALSVINALTCLRFEPAILGDRDKVEFTYGSDCSSRVGKSGGTQEISLGKNCDSPGTVMHEVMHALGFWHEQSRHDRDDYVQIIYTNLKPGTQSNFFKKPEREIETFGSPYDYRSLMQYDSFAFTKNSQPTLVKTGTRELISRQRLMLSKQDQYQLQAMYECKETRGVPKTTHCMHPLDRGVSYRGNMAKTASGIPCQRWDSMSPHHHFFTPDALTGAGLEENYCRNPDIDDKPWCYTMSNDVDWEYCDIPVCENPIPLLTNPQPLTSKPGFWSNFNEWGDCSVTCGNGTKLRTRMCIGSRPGSDNCPGKHWEHTTCSDLKPCTDNTVSGIWKRWSAWSSCSASCGFSGKKYKVRVCSDKTCKGKVIKKETCNVENCDNNANCYDANDLGSYRGRISVASNGKRCLKWKRIGRLQTDYPNSNLVRNYCRNPTKDRFGPYCYIWKVSKSVKKYCDISRCQYQEVVWTEFGDWSSCTASCGPSLRYRTRTCRGGVVGQGSCIGNVTSISSCTVQPCVDKEASEAENEIPAAVIPVFPRPNGGIGCVDLENPQAYRGTASTTYAGFECQDWTSQYPNSHHYRTMDRFNASGLSKNYCRAPESGDKWPWCYALSYDVRQQPCDIPMCDPVPIQPKPDVGCFNRSSEKRYEGSWSTTMSGYECQRWDANFPHQHKTYKPYNLVNQGIGPHNYCRNPDGDILPWCISTNFETFWEYCNVPLC